MRAVKGFVVLAIVLLIPSIGYFQKQHFQNHLKPRLEAEVRKVLEAEGVQAPSVHLDYLDAVISGRVDTDEQRQLVAARVDSLSGVRMTTGGNQLHTYGWLGLTREGGSLKATGVLTKGRAISLPNPLVTEEGWDDGVERQARVDDPRGMDRWREFLSYYFKEAGNRSVELRVNALTMRGDATAGLRSDWLSKASEVVPKDNVFDDFTLHPSVFHFPGYIPRSVQDRTVLEQLRRQFGANVVSFDGESSELSGPERDKVILAARAIITAGESARYVVGGHPARSGNATTNSQRARQRAGEVVKVLVEHGVIARQLDVMAFSVTPGEERENEVEIVVK